MKKLARLGLWLCVALLGSTASAQGRPFVVVQTMHYKGGVDLTDYGVKANPIVYERYLLPSKLFDDPASQEMLKKTLDAIPKGPLPTVLDIERWPTSVADPQRRRANVAKLVNALQRVREARPDMTYGYYGELPARAYEALIDPTQQAKRDAWVETNEQAKKDFAPYVDAVFPSLYTFHDDARAWEAYAKGMLTEARRFDKPTYCYLWPQFHPSNKKLVGQYLSPQLWRLQLETCRAQADGIVIWNHEPAREWDPEAPWWKETVAFLRQHHLVPAR